MVKKLVKRKKISVKKILIILLFVILSILAIWGIYKFTSIFLFDKDNKKVVENVKKEEINLENYDYFIRSNATDYEKTLFNELTKVLSKEEVLVDDYAKIIAKLFTSDLFTLSNKTGSSDITSSQYVYDNYRSTFELMVKDTMYASIEIDLDGKREQDLPTVKNVEISSVEMKKFYEGNEVLDDNAYYIVVSIEYEKDFGYPSTYEVVLVKNNDLLQVVKAS